MLQMSAACEVRKHEGRRDYHRSLHFYRAFCLITITVSVASQKHAAMKLNIANPSTGQMKVILHSVLPALANLFVVQLSL
jgi:hypothetical protein